ncbi:hypothetical protein [Streptomyces sp. NPDC003032]
MGRRTGVGTTFRFVLLLTLITVSSVIWLYSFFTGDNKAIAKDLGCQIVSDAVKGPDQPAVHAMYLRCMEGHQPAICPAWQKTFLAVLGLAVVALIIYVLLPAWKHRRRCLVPLAVPSSSRETADPLLAELAELRSRTGVPAHRVRFALAPFERSCSAVAFGRFGRNTIALNAGLVSRYATGRAKHRATDVAEQPNNNLQAFRGVVLHELNHIVNRDIGLAYATVAAWRAFLLVVLAPVVILILAPLFDTATPGFEGPFGERAPLVLLGLVTAVYLARADILRVREYHADALPPEWGGDLRGLLVAGRDMPRPWHVRLRHAMRRPWHPSNAARRRAVDDPAQLFRVGLLPIGLAGFVGAVLASQSKDLFLLGVRSIGPGTPVLWLTAGLVLTVVATPIWRAAMYAADNGTPYPQGWREGTALGTGLVAGCLIALRRPDHAWLPHNPWLLVIVLAGAIVAGVWMAQLSSLSVQQLPTRLRTPGSWVGQLTAVLTFGTLLWFFFRWVTQGFNGEDGLARLFSGVSSSDGWLPLARPAALLLNSISYGSGNVAAVVGALLSWLAPTVILIRSPLRPREDPRPGIRQVFLPGFICAIGALIAVVVLNSLWHDDLQRSDADFASWLLYEAWVEAVLIAAAAVAAAITAATLRGPSVPYAVTAGGITLLTGALGTETLWILDGCLGPLNVWVDVCTSTDRTFVFSEFSARTLEYLAGPFVFGSIMTIGAAVTGSAVRGLAGRLLGRHDGSHPPASPVSTSARSPRVAVPLAVMVLVLAAWTLSNVAKGTAPADPTEPDQISEANQAWRMAGGIEINIKLLDEQVYIIERANDAILAEEADDATAEDALDQATRDGRAACRRLSRHAARAERFIPIPDHAAQELWKAIYTAARSTGDHCATGQMTIFDAAQSLQDARLERRLDARLKQIGAK